MLIKRSRIKPYLLKVFLISLSRRSSIKPGLWLALKCKRTNPHNTTQNPRTTSAEPLYPAEGEHIQSVRFEWRPVENASHYQIQASTDRNTWELPYLIFDFRTNQTSFTPPKGTKIPANGTIYWRVRPLDQPSIGNEITGVWSNETALLPSYRSFVRDFHVAAYELPGDGATVNPPDLHWAFSQYADNYKIVASSGSTSWNYTTDNLSATPEETSTVKPGSTYLWRITPIDADNVPGFTSMNPWSFTVATSTPENNASLDIQLLSPANGATFNIMPSFKWTPYISAEKYRIYYQRDGELGWYDLIDSYSHTTAYTSYTPKKILTSGSYKWYVQPTDKNGIGIGFPSGIGTLTVTEPPVATMSQPDNASIINTTPTFKRDAAPKAAYYHIKVYADKDLTTLYDEAKTIFTSWTPMKSYADNSIGTGYYWYVYAVDGSDRYGSLVLGNVKSFEKHSTEPEQLSPDDGADVTNRPTLKWSLVNGAASYQVQVATDPNFGTGTIKIDRNTVDGPNLNVGSEKYPTRTLAEGTYYWRVRIIDASHNPGPWSDARTFTRTKPTVSLLSPANSAELTSTPVFEWQGLPGAASYKVVVSTSSNFSSTYEQKTTYLTSWAPLMTSPTYGANTYYWKVAPIDGSNHTGEFSQVNTFTIDGGAPSGGGTGGGAGSGGGGAPEPEALPIPTNLKATGSQNDIALTWNQVVSSNLAGYNVYRADSSSGPWQKLNSGLTLQTTFIEKSAAAGKTYYFAVTAVSKANSETSKSSTVSAARTAVLPQVVLSDVPTYHWASTFIFTLATKDILGGYSDGSFRPERTITRAEFAKAVVKAKGWALINPAAPSFRDMPRTHWAYQYVETARQRGIISGYADGTFGPGNNITRAEICKMIVIGAEYSLQSSGTSLSDLTASHWAYRYVITARNYSTVGGYADGTFRPSGYTTRAESSKMLYKMLGI